MPPAAKARPAKSGSLPLRRPRVPPARPAVFNVHDAKTQLSRLLARVAAGEEIVIARDGQPLARLVPLAPAAPHPPRVPGRFAGMFGPGLGDEALAPLPPEQAGLVTSPTNPLSPA